MYRTYPKIEMSSSDTAISNYIDREELNSNALEDCDFFVNMTSD
jgi:hypothetical protein